MLTRATRRAVRANGDDSGVTLIELLVGMTLMLIVGVMTTTFFVSTNDASTKTVDANIATSSARNVLESWTRLLNLADSPQTAGTGVGRFEKITPTSAVFYSNINNNRATASGLRTAPIKISLSLENGKLVERHYAPLSSVAPSSYPSSATETLYLATDVETSGWLFAPYRSGNPPTLTLPNYCVNDTTAGLCSDDAAGAAILPTIVRVDISFTVQTVSGVNRQYSSSAVITGGTT